MAETGMTTQCFGVKALVPFFTLVAQAYLAAILSTYVLSAQGHNGEKKKKNIFLVLMQISLILMSLKKQWTLGSADTLVEQADSSQTSFKGFTNMKEFPLLLFPLICTYLILFVLQVLLFCFIFEVKIIEQCAKNRYKIQ